jgi:hypothetical protein
MRTLDAVQESFSEMNKAGKDGKRFLSSGKAS